MSGPEQDARRAGAASRPRPDPSDRDDARSLAGVFDAAGAAMAVLSGADLRFELVNAAYRALTPRPDLDPAGRRYAEVWPGEGPVALATLERVRDTGERCHSDDHAFEDRGEVRRFSFDVKPVPWRGEAALLVVLWETTALWEAKHDAEEAAQGAVRRASELEAIVEALPDALVIYGRRGEIVRMNPAAERLLAFTAEEKALPYGARWGRTRMFAVDGRPIELDEAPVPRALRGETVRGAHLRVEGPAGSGWVLASAAPIRAPDGAVWGAVLTFSDETDLHRLEAARDDLVRMVSHDLRTPLSAILAQTHLLRSEESDPERIHERARSIARNCERMRAMIQDLLEATLLEAGQLRMSPTELELASFARDVIDRNLGGLAVDRVRLDAPERVPALGDPQRLERVLVNLVSNALKYSPPQGEVTVRVAPVDRGAQLCVEDRGVGIAPEDVPYVFDRFFRARGARQPEGLGLGLYISRLLVNAHGGRIEVESQLGCGSTFRVFLPGAGSLRE